MAPTHTYRHLMIAFTALLASCAARCGAATPPENEEAKAEPQGPSFIQGASSCVDGARAIENIERLVELGPRHTGTEGLERARGLITGTLEGYGLSPDRRNFTALTPHPDMKRVPMANITVDFPAASGKTVIIGGHFDGKIIDHGVFQGANDGGSSTGLLLEMARCLKEHPPTVPVRIAFFDGEEALLEWSDSDSLYGSKRMAAELMEGNAHREIAAMVNVDMIGDARLRIFRETMSTRWVFAALERSADRLGYGELMNGPRAAVEDDHVPFLRIGIPSANLIDLQFGPGFDSNDYWHTDRDTVDKLSPDSITAVGRIVLESLEELQSGSGSGD